MSYFSPQMPSFSIWAQVVANCSQASDAPSPEEAMASHMMLECCPSNDKANVNCLTSFDWEQLRASPICTSLALVKSLYLEDARPHGISNLIEAAETCTVCRRMQKQGKRKTLMTSISSPLLNSFSLILWTRRICDSLQ